MFTFFSLVDELLICCKSNAVITGFKNMLSDKFKMKDVSEGTNFIGIDIKFSYEQGNILTLG